MTGRLNRAIYTMNSFIMNYLKEGYFILTKTELAPYQPFDTGIPKINGPTIYGASPDKDIMYRLPVTGKRPIKYSELNGLPDGTAFDSQRGILSGSAAEGEYKLCFKAENDLGTSRKNFLLRIAKDGMCQTPLMGWCSWNAFRNDISQDKIADIARLMDEEGLAAYGYQYVNIDSGWQGEYCNQCNAILPNDRFPDISSLCREVHGRGLKIGIYSTPMLKAWGGGEYPGCTQGPVDPAFINAYFGIGKKHLEKENARQWDEWGIDYLKYDWSPCDIQNAGLMKQCLDSASRDIAFCVTVRADISQVDYWKNHCTSWRDNVDSDDRYEILMNLMSSSDDWAPHCSPGHFFDLDMLEVGTQNGNPCRLTEDEQLIAYSFRTIFPSPLQASCDLSKLSDFERAMLCNEEIIAVNQDALGLGAVCVAEEKTKNSGHKIKKFIKIYEKPLEDGGYAFGVFNLGEETVKVHLPFDGKGNMRDLWAKKDLGSVDRPDAFVLEPHTVRMLKVTPV